GARAGPEARVVVDDQHGRAHAPMVAEGARGGHTSGGTLSGRGGCGGGCRGAAGRRGPPPRPCAPPTETGRRGRPRAGARRRRGRSPPPGALLDLREREAAVPPGRHEEVLAVRRAQDGVEALVGSRG